MSDPDETPAPEARPARRSRYWLAYVGLAVYLGLIWGTSPDARITVWGVEVSPIMFAMVVAVPSIIIGWAAREPRGRRW